jgi:WhiB family redox-sensing transcriptional regulator
MLLHLLFGAHDTWKESAACKDAPPGRFHRKLDEPDRLWRARVGVLKDQYCDRCPVRVDCLQAAVSNREPEGVWGGFEFPRERRRAVRAARTSTPSRSAAPLLTPLLPVLDPAGDTGRRPDDH